MGVMPTVERMLLDRGYSEPASFKGSAVCRKTTCGKTAVVYDKRGESIGVEWVRKLVTTARGVDCVIVIFRPSTNGVSYIAKQELGKFGAQLFADTMLLKPYVYSIYVPKHTLSSIEEAQRHLSTIRLEAMPTISHQDPVCRWYGWKPGCIIRIEQKFGNINPYVTFEVVTAKSIE